MVWIITQHIRVTGNDTGNEATYNWEISRGLYNGISNQIYHENTNEEDIKKWELIIKVVHIAFRKGIAPVTKLFYRSLMTWINIQADLEDYIQDK